MITPIDLIQPVVHAMASAASAGSSTSPHYWCRFSCRSLVSTFLELPTGGFDRPSWRGRHASFARHNVTVNNLLPGMFDTDRLRNSTRRMAEMEKKSEETMAAQRKSTVRCARFGEAQELGTVCAFLLRKSRLAT